MLEAAAVAASAKAAFAKQHVLPPGQASWLTHEALCVALVPGPGKKLSRDMYLRRAWVSRVSIASPTRHGSSTGVPQSAHGGYGGRASMWVSDAHLRKRAGWEHADDSDSALDASGVRVVVVASGTRLRDSAVVSTTTQRCAVR